MYTVCVCVAIDLTQQSAELFCRLHQINRDAAAFAAVLDVAAFEFDEIALAALRRRAAYTPPDVV